MVSILGVKQKFMKKISNGVNNKNSYLKLNYKPNHSNEIIATFYGKSKSSLSELTKQVAAESSIGTWTKLSTLSDKVFARLAARVFYLNNKTGIFKIA